MRNQKARDRNLENEFLCSLSCRIGTAAQWVLLLALGGFIGNFVFSFPANLQGPSVHACDNFIYGAPPLAPLLFPNLVVLGIIALWQIRTRGA